jgi:aspartate aminotransferase
MSISVLAQNLRGSEIIKIAGEINELKKQGQNIANLTIGDFDSNLYPIPADLKAGIVAAYGLNQTNYPPADGVLDLRESVSEFLQNRMGLSYKANEILISGGSRPLIYSIFLAIVDPGDTVVFPAPSWNNNHYSDLTSANAVIVQTRPTFKRRYLAGLMLAAEPYRYHVYEERFGGDMRPGDSRKQNPQGRRKTAVYPV